MRTMPRGSSRAGLPRNVIKIGVKTRAGEGDLASGGRSCRWKGRWMVRRAWDGMWRRGEEWRVDARGVVVIWSLVEFVDILRVSIGSIDVG